mmetsp:Transcript_91094/g.262655  ORF Transcript_91094/g.262655 Transcript_91094/m.262655 type:complete len:608 (-) Transcript_91094:172-1995(-)
MHRLRALFVVAVAGAAPPEDCDSFGTCDASNEDAATALGVRLGSLPAAAASGDAGPAPRRQSLESVLLQSRAVLGHERLDSSAAPVEGAWSAGPFGDCIRCSTGDAKRRRQVECRSLFDGGVLPLGRCASSGPRPAAQEPCSCEDAPCKAGACEEDLVATKSVGEAEPAAPSAPFNAIGCLAPSSASDVESVAAASHAQDPTCIGWTADDACNGGLPFYRMRSNGMSPDLCFSFCLGKGLDLFGLSSGGDCRCGASALNSAVWRGKAPRRGLKFPMELLRPETAEGACPLRVYRYVGHFQDGGVPFDMTDATVGDEAYIDSIVAGHAIRSESEEDTRAMDDRRSLAASATGAQKKDLTGEWWGERPSWTRPCWPRDCGPGGGVWKKRWHTLIAGISGRWQEYAVIEFFFEAEVDDTRRNAFRKAVEAWEAVTCIHFVEAAAQPLPPALLVANSAAEREHCYATHIGYPGNNDYATINLGWCNDERYVGNIIHELGHVLGMNHEQKRPDAVQKYHGKGPHLVVHWENVGKWADQYEADPDSYTGSDNDGAGDAQIGYADYDFGSIMHYPTGDHFETIPSDKGVLTGNRHSLTEGDIVQVLDMYQCKRK